MDSFRYLIGLVACAFTLGAAFDLYNTILGSTKWLRWLRPLLDILFWVAAAGLVYYVAFLTQDGQLRVYTFVILLLGYGLYRLLLHRLVVGSAIGTVRVIRGFVLVCVRIVHVLLVRPATVLLWSAYRLLVVLYRGALVLENGGAWVMRFLLKVTLFPFRKIWPANSRWVNDFCTRWEDFWTWLSKRIANQFR